MFTSLIPLRRFAALTPALLSLAGGASATTAVVNQTMDLNLVGLTAPCFIYAPSSTLSTGNLVQLAVAHPRIHNLIFGTQTLTLSNASSWAIAYANQSSTSTTASHLRQRIETVLDRANAHGYRNGDNPATWKAHVQAVMPAPQKVTKVENLATLSYAEVHAFIATLRQRSAMAAMAAMALEFTVPTAARTSKATGAK